MRKSLWLQTVLLFGLGLIFSACSPRYHQVKMQPQTGQEKGIYGLDRESNTRLGQSEDKLKIGDEGPYLELGQRARLWTKTGNQYEGVVIAIGDSIVLENENFQGNENEMSQGQRPGVLSIPISSIVSAEVAGREMNIGEKITISVMLPLIAGFAAVLVVVSLFGVPGGN